MPHLSDSIGHCLGQVLFPLAFDLALRFPKKARPPHLFPYPSNYARWKDRARPSRIKLE